MVTFTEKILNGKLLYLYSEKKYVMIEKNVTYELIQSPPIIKRTCGIIAKETRHLLDFIEIMWLVLFEISCLVKISHSNFISNNLIAKLM